MKTGLDFLLAAKRCEIDGLQRLALTATWVDVTARLVHTLQRERGLSNMYLAAQGERHTGARLTQIAMSRQVEADWRQQIERVDASAAQAGPGARLFSRIAYVLQGLDGLDALRQRIDERRWDTAQSTEAYVRLIAALLAVVFEAADSASDPAISRRLVALFNFMQGKEFAGQERAVGAAMFGSGHAEQAEQQRLLHLIESQERCLEVVGTYAPPEIRAMLSAPHVSATLADLERLRRVLCTTTQGSVLKPELSQVWFDTCTARIDAMKAVEDRLTQDLGEACSAKIAQAQAELASFGAISADAPPDPLDFYQAAGDGAQAAQASKSFALTLERSVLDLVHDQAKRLQAMGDELEAVRASLNERRVIERAKGLLMAHRHLSEAEAHKTLRQMAMNQNRRIVDVAEAVLAMADVLPAARS
ncbi:MAG: nitrate- and nitrite sensing domain-containing protein [Hydrogenophaga sp.]|uniref:nitrate regulatory protein n=1 Tax=Hydrogenophaga sp. TaxID=1904254 RepID=UPI001E1A25F7|nr:nitrate regulatory protein [Hydrogenophaga sp.]MBX3611041.1 nitrate- and nitrite sensing domain-containing protein [Hydrogenophaga sp.]